MRSTLERVTAMLDGTTASFARALSRSRCVSCDMAHAVHPNYLDRYDDVHQVRMNGGPVVKLNVNQRYATDGRGVGYFKRACSAAGVPLQYYVHRSDIACGSTVGPVLSAGLGVETVDVGLGMLAMHSAREVCGSADPPMLTRALAEFWAN